MSCEACARRSLFWCGVLLLASCASTPRVVSIPQDRYVPIPADLDADCPIPALESRTVGGAIELAVKLKGALIQCNDRMAGIRAISGVPVK